MAQQGDRSSLVGSSDCPSNGDVMDIWWGCSGVEWDIQQYHIWVCLNMGDTLW